MDRTITRMDLTHPVTVFDRQDLGRRIRVHRWRQAAAIGLWVAIVAIIILILIIGSKPASGL